MDEYTDPSEQKAYWQGRLVGDGRAIAQAPTEISGGTGGGLATGGETLGIGFVVDGSVALHGVGVGYIGASDATKTGRLLYRLNMVSHGSTDEPSPQNTRLQTVGEINHQTRQNSRKYPRQRN